MTPPNEKSPKRLEKFYQNVIGNSVNGGRQNIEVNIGQIDAEFTFDNNNSCMSIIRNAFNIQILVKSFTYGTFEEVDNVFDTVENRIRHTILTAMDRIFVPKIELAVWWKNASSHWDVASVMAVSEREEQSETKALIVHASNRNNTFHEPSPNHETRGYNPISSSEFAVTRIQFDREWDINYIWWFRVIRDQCSTSFDLTY